MQMGFRCPLSALSSRTFSTFLGMKDATHSLDFFPFVVSFPVEILTQASKMALFTSFSLLWSSSVSSILWLCLSFSLSSLRCRLSSSSASLAALASNSFCCSRYLALLSCPLSTSLSTEISWFCSASLKLAMSMASSCPDA